jgi:hypothetical protein
MKWQHLMVMPEACNSEYCSPDQINYIFGISCLINSIDMIRIGMIRIEVIKYITTIYGIYRTNYSVCLVESPYKLGRGFAPGFVNHTKGCTRLAAASDKLYQLLTHGLILQLLPPLKIVAMI